MNLHHYKGMVPVFMTLIEIISRKIILKTKRVEEEVEVMIVKKEKRNERRRKEI